MADLHKRADRRARYHQDRVRGARTYAAQLAAASDWLLAEIRHVPAAAAEIVGRLESLASDLNHRSRA